MSDDERKELNLKAGRLILSHGIPLSVSENGHEKVLREKLGHFGYADYYLQESYDESALRNKAEIEIYKEFLQIDGKLGTTQTEKLFGCVYYSGRMDLIKVRVILTF